MRTRKILVVLTVLLLTFVSCFAVGCGSADANVGGVTIDAETLAETQALIDKFIQDNKLRPEDTLTIPFTVNDTAKVVTVTKDDFDFAEFGTYEGTYDYGSAQDMYIQAIYNDLFAGKRGNDNTIPSGKIVLVNFGSRANETTGYFMHIGKRKFVQLQAESSIDCKDSLIPNLFYTPKDYRLITCNHKGGGKYLLRVLEKVARVTEN